MAAKKLCTPCRTVRDNPELYLMPRHVVHPEHGRPGVWSVRCEAVCVDCGAVWRHGRDNRAALVVRA
jgi:hypothetical protein